MKILNLYAGIGGNRKLWGDEHEITAVEINPEIAKIYSYLYPNDKIIIGDSIEYLEKNFQRFDFIWASPPCQSHSRINRFNVARRYNGEINIKVKIPDFRLYSIINFLDKSFRGHWVVENTYSDYEPLKKPQRLGRHFIWSNTIFNIKDFNTKPFHKMEKHSSIKELCELHGLPFDFIKSLNLKGIDKKQVLRNCVEGRMGKMIFDQILGKSLMPKGEEDET